jgi:hypothetical protein
LSFLTRALATDVLPEAEAPAMPITWSVNHGGLYCGLSVIAMVESLRGFRTWPKIVVSFSDVQSDITPRFCC